MKVCYAEEMRNIDRLASSKYGLPSIVLMENAAISCVKYLEKFDKITVVCGKGNNAGDGLCVARHLINKGKSVKVYLAMGEEFSGDALINYNILKNMSVEFYSCDNPMFDYDIEKSDCVCDAIFGTGIKGEIKSPVKETIQKINKLSNYVLSVDVPSGIDADTGNVESVAVIADKTVTFAAYKRGLLLYPGAEYAGEVEVSDISIPKELLKDISVESLDEDEALEFLPPRRPNSQKGDYGRVMVIGGTKGMAGAVSLAVKGAFKVGAGLVTACVPYELNDIIQCSVLEATVFSADFEKEQDKILEKIQEFDAVLFGNGVGREKHIIKLLENVLLNAKCPVVIDADGLFALKDNLEILNKAKSHVILTPHSMEFARLLGTTVSDVESDRLGHSRSFVEKYSVTLVLKGNHTIITTPDLKQNINMTGNSGMATAGSGDVLAGMVLGFIPRCNEVFDASKLAVYMHGKAGDYAKSILGENSMTASDILDGIPHIFPVEK